MTTLSNLVTHFDLDEAALMHQAQSEQPALSHLLTPFSPDPTGEDPSYDDDFQRIREEVNKLSGIDTGLICQLAEKLLTELSKDLRVLTFYIWARLHQDGEAGFAEGLGLLAAMFERFGKELHPQRERSRQTSLEWLGSARVTDSLSLYPEVDGAIMQRILGALLVIDQHIQGFPEAARPDLSKLYQALEDRLAQSGGAHSLVPQTSSSETHPSTAVSAPEIKTISSGRDLLDQAKVLAKYLRDQPSGWLASHHLIKSVRWDTLVELPPLDEHGRTRLKPPKPEHRAHLKRLYLQKNWLELLEHTDALFAQGVNHLWLDIQWYAWQALMKQDDVALADILSRDLKGLLIRLPSLETLTFNDGTPFCDDVTQAWINEQVLDDMPDWNDEPVTPSDTSSDDVLSLEPEILAKADAEGIETALAWLQAQPDHQSAREKWLIRLLMARVTEQYGKNEMSLHLLGELDSGASLLTLEDWMPELIFEVKARRLKLLRAKANRSESDKARLQPAMDSLLSGLISLDPARAAVLCG
ncbi:MAG: type VI secretion system protein TssA [Vibrio sp.]